MYKYPKTVMPVMLGLGERMSHALVQGQGIRPTATTRQQPYEFSALGQAPTLPC